MCSHRELTWLEKSMKMLSKTTVPDIICIYFSPDLQLGCSYFLCVCSDVNICVPLLILPLGSEIENNI